MAPDTVFFTGFPEGFNTKKVRLTHANNESAFWPEDWMMVIEKSEATVFNGNLNLDVPNYYRWISDNCKSRVEVIRDNHSSLRVFAFEDHEEGILFKLSF